MCCGSSSNTKVQLLALWMILYFSSHLQLDGLRIFGDAKVIVDWATNECMIDIIHLSSQMNSTCLMLCSFKDISCSHVYRKFNMLVDSLSIKALNVDVGHICWENRLTVCSLVRVAFDFFPLSQPLFSLSDSNYFSYTGSPFGIFPSFRLSYGFLCRLCYTWLRPISILEHSCFCFFRFLLSFYLVKQSFLWTLNALSS